MTNVSLSFKSWLTVIMATITVGTECLVVGYAAGWALANLLELSGYWAHGMEVLGLLGACAVSLMFAQKALQVERKNQTAGI